MCLIRYVDQFLVTLKWTAANIVDGLLYRQHGERHPGWQISRYHICWAYFAPPAKSLAHIAQEGYGAPWICIDPESPEALLAGTQEWSLESAYCYFARCITVSKCIFGKVYIGWIEESMVKQITLVHCEFCMCGPVAPKAYLISVHISHASVTCM